jgi:hypothetical protein
LTGVRGVVRDTGDCSFKVSELDDIQAFGFTKDPAPRVRNYVPVTGNERNEARGGVSLADVLYGNG